MPTALRILRSNAKDAARLAKRQIETPGDLADAPDWFNSEQKLDWAYAIANAPRNVLKRIDKALLAAFIVALDTHRRATVAMAATLLVKSPTQGLPIQSPYLPIINRQAMLMTRMASELGFTPCSRARIEGANIPASPSGEWADVESA